MLVSPAGCSNGSMEKDGLFLQEAGAGAGKTTELIERVVDLLGDEEETGLIVVGAYTRESVLEIQKRVAAHGGARDTRRRLVVGTLHSIAGRALNHFRRQMNLPPLKIHGDGRSMTGILEIIHQEVGNRPQIISDLRSVGVYGDLRNLATRLGCLIDLLPSNCLYSADELAPYFTHPGIAGFAADCLGRWRRELANAPYSDYSRILPEVTGLMRQHPKNQHLLAPLDVLIDEFQDLSPRQIEFIDVLCRRARSLYAVGCPDQSIYDFRAGGRVPFAQLPEVLVYASHLKEDVHWLPALDFSHRCPQAIADASASLLACNKTNMMVPMRGHAEGNISVGWFHSEDAEVETVAGSLSRMPISSYGGTAILGRTHQVVEPFLMALISQQVPVRAMRGDDPVGAMILGRVAAWLRISLSPADLDAGKQILRAGIPGIGPATLVKIEKRLQAHDAVFNSLTSAAAMPGLKRPQVAAVNQVARELQEASAVLKRDGDLIHWLQWLNDRRAGQLAPDGTDPEEFQRSMDFAFRLARACHTPGRFLDTLAEPTHSEHVTVGTFHASKGHGWDTVFIVGASKYNMEALHERCQDRLFAPGVLDGGIDGERRLLHVGMTRAAHDLIVTWSGGPDNASAFVAQANLEVADHPGIVIPRPREKVAAAKKKDVSLQLALF